VSVVASVFILLPVTATAADSARHLTAPKPGWPLAHPIAPSDIAPPPLSLLSDRPVNPAYVPALRPVIVAALDQEIEAAAAGPGESQPGGQRLAGYRLDPVLLLARWRTGAEIEIHRTIRADQQGQVRANGGLERIGGNLGTRQ
jgi:hypothetical protein